jgi:uncharacterized protein YndB with AHSA1/START domain
VTDVVLQPGVGGRLYELWDDGTEHDWGEILEWDEPARFVCTWRPNHERVAPTEVEVSFTEEGDKTVVRLEHRAWERLGADGPAQRDDYKSGWAPVLERYARRCEDSPAGGASGA